MNPKYPVDDLMPLGEEYVSPSENTNCNQTQYPTSPPSSLMSPAPSAALATTSLDTQTVTLIALDANTLSQVKEILHEAIAKAPTWAEMMKLPEALVLLSTPSRPFRSEESQSGPVSSGIMALEPSVVAALISPTTVIPSLAN